MTGETSSRREMSVKLRKTAKAQWRAKTASIRPMPAFIIIGAQRAGTSSVYDWICTHPQVLRAVNKELHYFDGRNYHRGESWYRSRFPILPKGKMTGESTPQMLYNPMSAGRAAKDLPQSTRFVVLLRNPVERAISHYWLQKRKGVEKEDLQTALALEKERLAAEEDAFQSGGYSFAHHKFSYVARGDYATQLTEWFNQVGRHRVLVLESERLLSDADKRLQLTEWLGLTPIETPMPALNSAPRLESYPDVISGLEEHFEPMNRRLFELLGQSMWGR
jgi:Sulfotransferase domain